MTSVVDKYYKRIIQNIDNVRMKFDISSLLVKTKEHDSKINANESNISSNLSKISTNKSDISSNLNKINPNKSDISSNLSLVNTNKSNITNNYNISQINKKKSEFNTTLIDNNKNNISSNLSKVNTIEQNYKLKDIIITDIIKSNIPETIDINNNEFVIIKYSLNNLKKDSYLQFDSSILIFFHKH